ncbi:MAG: hypothetical protein KJ018_15150 [Burkholderiales bacterium]|nr:hypothetical protein [Burkholderiales bacterium]
MTTSCRPSRELLADRYGTIKRSRLPIRTRGEFRKADLDARQALYQKLAERIGQPGRLAEEAAS